MNVDTIQELIDKTDYWDMRILDVTASYFGDEVKLLIENDEVTGCTVTVDLGDGYEAVYGQLKELNFAKGDYVEAGHVLGYVGEPTKYFTVEGSNLYFELDKDGTPVDPVAYFE